MDVLGLRALNRATLARQLLLARSTMTPLAAVHHLVGLQAQIPENPYGGLWSRLADFRPESLAQLYVDRAVVRIVVMRGTIHTVTAEDCLLLRALVQPVLTRELERHAQHAPKLVDVDLEEVLAFARERLAKAPLTHPELRDAFTAKFPRYDAPALIYACRNHLALIQTPPRGLWGHSAQITSSTAEAWLGKPIAKAPSIDAVALRYLGAFGPATAADFAAWSGLTGTAAVFARLRKTAAVRVFADERGRELLDLDDAARPDPDTPAPPRFLPEYDNALLSHADRARVIDATTKKALFTSANGRVDGAVLLDGMVTAGWSLRDGALTVKHLGPLTKPQKKAIGEEAQGLLALHDASDHDVIFTAVD